MERINKPIVFLSHSREDREFIEKLESHLKIAQIECWRDVINIRDGDSWLDAIFQDGISSCNAFLVYLTENSISSDMVCKEIDATIVKRLRDGKTKLLPYVSDESIRGKLRPDLQTLHCPVLNESNLDTMSSRIVGEVWRSYHEKACKFIQIIEEKKRRDLEVILSEMDNTKKSIFTSLEEVEFAAIYDDLNIVYEYTTSDLYIGEPVYLIKFNLLGILIIFLKTNVHIDTTNNSIHFVQKTSGIAQDNYGGVENFIHLLRKYSLLDILEIRNEYDTSHILEFSNRFYRFLYWIEYNEKKIPDSIVSKDKIRDAR